MSVLVEFLVIGANGVMVLQVTVKGAWLDFILSSPGTFVILNLLGSCLPMPKVCPGDLAACGIERCAWV